MIGNYENVIVIKHAETAQRFCHEYERMWEKIGNTIKEKTKQKIAQLKGDTSPGYQYSRVEINTGADNCGCTIAIAHLFAMHRKKLVLLICSCTKNFKNCPEDLHKFARENVQPQLFETDMNRKISKIHVICKI